LQRHNFTHDGILFSYLDTDDEDSNLDPPALIALHAHWMEAQTFAPLAKALAPEWRVIALDQRGHGDSGHASSYTREDYIGDLATLYELLELPDAVLLGNSLGGVNAFQFAARHPEKVRGMIIEDIGAVVSDADLSFMLAWAGTFPTREALAERIGQRFAPFLEESFRETADGWKVAFEPSELLQSQKNLMGNYWIDWIASSCPALVLRGRDSRVTTAEVTDEMVARRPNTQAMTLPGSHVLHKDDPAGFLTVVKLFLQTLP
jgi:esterase